MNPAKVDVHELIAWGLDEYPSRGNSMGLEWRQFAKQIEQAEQRLTERQSYSSCSALLPEETDRIRHLFAPYAQRTDLEQEYEGLDWTLAVVDLRRLLAFQRRLVFSQTECSSPIPERDDWPQLVSLAVGPQRGTEHCLACTSIKSGLDISLYSSNPDLQLRLKPGAESGHFSSLSLHGGSPFFEVAEHRGRWFLRDGYHRAYRLLQAGVHRMPAVVISARTLEELGATGPWFFSEDQLFSDRPPRVMDFLDENLVLRYERAALRKVIRIRVEESLEPFS